ncbi:CDP-glucose 4,6-dehydratase [Rhizobium paknamense]|uniref:CDP-glucose 4,6-dehydratase n=1 Tax=Rhizobium paknamense TaxID=1206817 RepID=A0ABU0IHR5_9HYPH|nr:CDP-glucose 4,6-dehydratase [Rhizobium paknamense]MDQ0456935.1 CDP-glucose 4,6-dehydratase [Rhizobium paknamense]
MMIDPTFWRGRRVLLTGHTGFKGSWLSLWLRDMGAVVTGLALPPESRPNLHGLLGESLPDTEICDLRDRLAVTAAVLRAEPEIVLHLAAQPLVRAGYRDPVGTFETNVQGTVHVLDVLRAVETVKAIVVVTTDKVYENPETARPFVESDPLGGHDPYSASKAAAEIVAASYRASFFAPRGVGLATARAGNVIGGGDWAQDRIVPDAVRAWSLQRAIEVRRPAAVRPWQHVLEPLAGYLALAERLYAGGLAHAAFNFGPDPDNAATVADLLAVASRAFGGGEVSLGTEAGPHEAGYLLLDSSRARDHLGYRPLWNFEETVVRTMGWYRRLAAGEAAIDLCRADIADYLTQMAETPSQRGAA